MLLGEARAIQAGMRDAEVPPRPQTMAQFQAWSKSTTTFVESVTRADQREHAVFLLGFVLGDLLLSLALRALTEDLLAAAPGHPLLTAQRASLLAAEEKRVGELRLCAENPGIPASARGCVAAMATSASDEDRRVAQPEALLAVLNGARAEMQRYLEE